LFKDRRRETSLGGTAGFGTRAAIKGKRGVQDPTEKQREDKKEKGKGVMTSGHLPIEPRSLRTNRKARRKKATVGEKKKKIRGRGRKEANNCSRLATPHSKAPPQIWTTSPTLR